jgi:hypothetical protein
MKRISAIVAPWLLSTALALHVIAGFAGTAALTEAVSAADNHRKPVAKSQSKPAPPASETESTAPSSPGQSQSGMGAAGAGGAPATTPPTSGETLSGPAAMRRCMEIGIRKPKCRSRNGQKPTRGLCRASRSFPRQTGESHSPACCLAGRDPKVPVMRRRSHS